MHGPACLCRSERITGALLWGSHYVYLLSGMFSKSWGTDTWNDPTWCTGAVRCYRRRVAQIAYVENLVGKKIICSGYQFWNCMIHRMCSRRITPCWGRSATPGNLNWVHAGHKQQRVWLSESKLLEILETLRVSWPMSEMTAVVVGFGIVRVSYVLSHFDVALFTFSQQILVQGLSQ